MAFSCGSTRITGAVHTSLFPLLLFSLTNLFLSVVQHEGGWTDCKKKKLSSTGSARRPHGLLPPVLVKVSGSHQSNYSSLIRLSSSCHAPSHMSFCRHWCTPPHVQSVYWKKFRSLVP
ncbi:hypothetical protein VPH35_045058 [Triticum aestivum]